uniref:Disease resistance R13L4/SHOC-2-like LRR domain-containing protein n=1 Tax=viral metagenome TaxID=1070528 RepID=A0A6C0C646_9ZZZZ
MEYEDVVHPVLYHLELKHIIACSMVNKLFKKICDLQYSRLLDEDYPNASKVPCHKENYIAYHNINFFREMYYPSVELDDFLLKRDLILSSYKVNEIPDSIWLLNGLEYVQMCCNNIPIIPTSIVRLINLRELYLNHNKISKIPKIIGQLTNLRYLGLVNNQILMIPETIGFLINLEELRLCCNQICVIPESIGQLVKLKSLGFNFNNVTKLPKSIGHLINLRELWFMKNPIVKIPKIISQLNCNIVSVRNF